MMHFFFLLLSRKYEASKSCVSKDKCLIWHGLNGDFPKYSDAKPLQQFCDSYNSQAQGRFSFFTFSDNISLSFFFFLLLVYFKSRGTQEKKSHANEILGFPFKDTSIIFY